MRKLKYVLHTIGLQFYYTAIYYRILRVIFLWLRSLCVSLLGHRTDGKDTHQSMGSKQRTHQIDSVKSTDFIYSIMCMKIHYIFCFSVLCIRIPIAMM